MLAELFTRYDIQTAAEVSLAGCRKHCQLLRPGVFTRAAPRTEVVLGDSMSDVFSQLPPDLEGMVKVKTGIDTRSENLAHQAAATARIRPTTRNCIRRNPTCDWSVSTSESRIQCQSKKFDALASSDGRFAPLVRRKFLLNIKRSGSKLVLGGAGLRQRRARSNSTTARP
jgi:hypothetical protein